jgi:hypothetical protein
MVFMSLRVIIPKNISHMSMNNPYSPFRKFNKREQIDRNTSKAGFDENYSSSI